jgi:membrane fusion protein, adhesin transport system
MLNISRNSIVGKIATQRYLSFKQVEKDAVPRGLSILLIFLFSSGVAVLFIPWTQNIRGRGYVTTIQPDQRPQTVHTIIGGRIEKWFVREGDFVLIGDTIAQISEIKDDYFDPLLMDRTSNQIEAKMLAAKAYRQKADALQQQIEALGQMQQFKLSQARNKLEQARLKVKSDSIDLEAARVQFDIVEYQNRRMQQLYEEGLKSLTDLEGRNLGLQEALAKRIGAENNLLSSANDQINALIELEAIDSEFSEKLAKAESDRMSALTELYQTEVDINKLRNQLSNYSIRNSLYFIRAPQNGYVTKALQVGIGETVKEGTPLVSIMPRDYELAVEMYVRPMDLPLIRLGQPVRFIFDGWPAIVFSGWPNVSYGTFGGKVFAVDNFISDNGKYRIMIAPDPMDESWPEALRVGSGANGFALLRDVPIWYELWRQINGFPPDYYLTDEEILIDTAKE